MEQAVTHPERLQKGTVCTVCECWLKSAYSMLCDRNAAKSMPRTVPPMLFVPRTHPYKQRNTTLYAHLYTAVHCKGIHPFYALVDRKSRRVRDSNTKIMLIDNKDIIKQRSIVFYMNGDKDKCILVLELIMFHVQ